LEIFREILEIYNSDCIAFNIIVMMLYNIFVVFFIHCMTS
jgi:hypothetical protein